jgi:RNA-directed DNA polymerase
MDTSRPSTVYTRLQRIAELARHAPDMVFTTLFHHVDMELDARGVSAHAQGRSGWAWTGRTRKRTRRTWRATSRRLLGRFKSGHVPRPPVRRVHIPKGDGSQTRPIGIPTFGDKVLQRAVAMLLEAVYEQDFLDCSYGFRPGRSAHGALDAVCEAHHVDGWGVGLEVDLRKFFDTLEHSPRADMLSQRVRDGVVTRT